MCINAAVYDVICLCRLMSVICNIVAAVPLSFSLGLLSVAVFHYLPCA